MALIKDQRTRLDVPHEEGQWIEVRPLRNGDLKGLDLQGDPFEGTIMLLERVVTAWSYDDPPTPETIRLLDMETTNWLAGEIQTMRSGRPEEEKNGSSTSSLPQVELVGASSPGS